MNRAPGKTERAPSLRPGRQKRAGCKGRKRQRWEGEEEDGGVKIAA